MRVARLVLISKISTVAMLALIASGCENGDASRGITTEANTAEDAAVDDVLGANDAAANDADPEGGNR